ncbi:MAG: Sec-independent protein translocase protein TatB [Stellaceae bacterium]
MVLEWDSMFDFSWSEILLVGVIALVVVGPKDLPRVLRTAGQWMGRARAVAREFQGQVDQLMRENELEDVRQHLSDAASIDPRRMIRNWIDPGGEVEKHLSDSEFLGESHTEEPQLTFDPELEPELPLAEGLPESALAAPEEGHQLELPALAPVDHDPVAIATTSAATADAKSEAQG